MDKQNVLQGALSLNGNDKKYQIQVDGDSIVTTVKWMDAVLFDTQSVTDEVKSFKFTAKLGDNNTWTETDESKSFQKSAGNGRVGMNYSSFKGKQITFSKTVGVGKDRETGKTGIVEFTFNSEEYKKPVRDYLKSCGYKKRGKGFFATLFGK